MSTTSTNGQIRKSLAEQIDRLDQLLDGLADALNEAVATAVKEAVGIAVKEAVQAVLTEVLTNPAVLARLHAVAAPPAPPANAAPTPSLGQRLGHLWHWAGRQLRSACQTACTLARRGRQACGTGLVRARQACGWLRANARVVRHFGLQLLTALLVGLAAGVAAYGAGPWLAAGVSALGGFATTLAVHAALWLRRAFVAPVVTHA